MAPAEEHMAFERWKPREHPTKQEEYLLHRLRRTRKLFAFLRDHRQELFMFGHGDGAYCQGAQGLKYGRAA
jgi:hypothetical protein